MATYQTDYSTSPAKGLPGQIANEEKCNKISRTVESAAGIEFGQPAFRGAGDHGVVVGAAFAATAVGAADAGNAGAGAITASPAVAAGAKQGAYKVVQVTGGATGAFNVFDPDGIFVGNGAVGTEFVGGGLTFTVTDPGADPAIGDSYTVTVTYSVVGDARGILRGSGRASPVRRDVPQWLGQPVRLFHTGPFRRLVETVGGMTTVGPPPKDGSVFRGIVGLLAVVGSLVGFGLLFFVAIPAKNENALMLALGIVFGWGSAVVQSEYGASTTGRKAAEAAVKQIEGK